MKNLFYKYNIFHVIIAFLFILDVLLIVFVYQNKDCKTNINRVSFLDVGQGDAIYIENDKGQNMLIDTGNKDSDVLNQIREVENCSRVNIDYLVLTHPDQDHIGEAYNLISKGFVKKVIHNGFLDIDQPGESQTENDLENIINTHHITKQNIVDLNTIDFPGFDIKVLFPWSKVYESKDKKKDDNYYSVVVKVEKGQKSFLLTGDASMKSERDILDKYCFKKKVCPELEADVLKLGHHGSKTSSSYDFLKIVNAREYIVSASKNNKYHHPSQETLDNINLLNKKVSHIRETSLEGNIVYVLD